MTAAVEVRVPSRTTPGAFHRVLVGIDGKTTCTCAAGEYRGDCWAQKYVREERMTNEHSQALVPIKVAPPAAMLPTQAELNVIGTLARTVIGARGHAVPENIDTPAKAAAIMLAGFELGVRPMTALRHVMVIKGKTEPDAQLMLGILQARESDARIEIVELTDEKCTMRILRPRRGINAEYTYTLKDAERAGLTRPSRSGEPSNWTKFPKDMLRWAVTKRLCRAYAPDIINSISSIDVGEVEELMDALDEAQPEPAYIEAATTPVAVNELYNPGDEPEDVDPATGEILDAEPAQGDVAPFTRLMDAQEWVTQAARKAKYSTTDVMEALGLEDSVAGYERMALDLDAYKARWQEKLDAAKASEAPAPKATRARPKAETPAEPAAAEPPAEPEAPAVAPSLPGWLQYLGQRCGEQGVSRLDICRVLGCSEETLVQDMRAWLEANGGLNAEAIDDLVAAAAGTRPVGAGA